jgi:hypothetical protein
MHAAAVEPRLRNSPTLRHYPNRIDLELSPNLTRSMTSYSSITPYLGSLANEQSLMLTDYKSM